MKKTKFFLMSLCALALFSCQKEEAVEDLTPSGYTYTLIGSAGPDTRISVADKVGAVWPVKWTGGDVIAVFKASDSEKLGSAKLAADDAGKLHGTFALTTESSHEGDVLIAHGSSLTYADGVISASVPAEQENIKAGVSTHIGKSGLAYAKAVMSGTDVPVDFVLEHKTAFVRLVLKTTEFAEHTLTGATLWCKSASLSGTVSADVETGAVTVSGTGDYVKAYIRKGNEAAFGSEAELWFSALPVDLTGKDDLYVIVHMTKGTSTVTVPVRIAGGELKSGAVNTITVSDLKTSSAPAWYETVETRNLLDGYAYGDANTHFVEQNPDEDKSSVISVKARGDFMKVSEPAYYGLYSGSSDMSGRKVFYLPNGVRTYEEVPTNAVSDDCCMTIYSYKGPQDNNNHGRWATVAVYDADYNLLWSFMIMKYLTGDGPKSISYSSVGYDMLDRNLGAIYSSDYAVSKGKTDNPWAYFQWGRKDPSMWSNSNLTDRYNIASADGVDIAASIANPGLQYGYLSDNDGDWKSVASGHDADLWGGVSDTKTIYDPCPKGYRVPDFEILDAVAKNAQRCEYSLGKDYQESANINASPYSDSSVLKYETSSGEYDYWPYGGALWGSSTTSRNRTGSNGKNGALYWSNALDSDGIKAQAISICYYSSSFNETDSEYRANAFAVRCMKDTENR